MTWPKPIAAAVGARWKARGQKGKEKISVCFAYGLFALVNNDLPFSSTSGAHPHASVIVFELLAFEFAFGLRAITHDCRAVAKHPDDNIGSGPAMQPIAGRPD